ncbi:hypothetical protein QQ045_031514 [Rhodiola kirilowii]
MKASPATQIFTLLVLITITSTAPTAPPPTQPPTRSPTSSSTLDPKQLTALQSLSIPISKDPCAQPSLHNATLCDAATPFRHLISLKLVNCSDDVALSITAFKSLSTLSDLQFLNCHVTPVHLPSVLTSSLRSFSAVNSLKHLTGVWVSKMQNLTDLHISNSPINASGPSVIINNMKTLKSVSITNSNLTGVLPKHWHTTLTHVDFSNNQLKGRIPSSLNILEDLEYLNLASNQLTGEIPSSIGDLLSLKNLSFASNSLSGDIPDSFSTMKSLIHLDFSSNQLNGTIPRFLSEMRNLQYLNLEKNSFHGVIPFNGSFIKRLAVFKIGGNSNLCFNHSTISPKVKLGIAPCDKHGMPLSPPPAKDTSGGGQSGDSEDDYSDDDGGSPKSSHHGPSKIVLGVAIGLSSIVFLIVFLILISKRCT